MAVIAPLDQIVFEIPGSAKNSLATTPTGGGGLKMEFTRVVLVTTADTFITSLQNPKFGFFVSAEGSNGAAVYIGCTISGRTVSVGTQFDSGLTTIAGFVVIGY